MEGQLDGYFPLRPGLCKVNTFFVRLLGQTWVPSLPRAVDWLLDALKWPATVRECSTRGGARLYANLG